MGMLPAGKLRLQLPTIPPSMCWRQCSRPALAVPLCRKNRGPPGQLIRCLTEGMFGGNVLKLGGVDHWQPTDRMVSVSAGLTVLVGLLLALLILANYLVHLP